MSTPADCSAIGCCSATPRCTIGPRTGLPRTAALTYARDGDAYLVVASNGGRPKPPTWLGNLKANPDCEIRVGRRRHGGAGREHRGS
jgi:deazaflavin-dependent oxidoreductase (nitroreductase family)